ncbi:ABC transporter permease [Sessilibacter corallicola]|uniref:ABC transporter permease n=1 Tax=Sessilibacter corallicola TaxID=2904075 RepID=A0ABQ0A7S3_9GAMM
MNELKLSLKLLWRNWRSGELKVLASAIVLAVTVVTAIAVFADRMDRSLQRQSNAYLAADRVISGRFPIPEDWQTYIDESAIEQSRTARFSSMVFAGNEMQLASIKAVAEGYPLRGTLEVSDVPFALGNDVVAAQGIPKSGEVWVDSRLLPILGVELGDTLSVGNKDFRISQVVIHEPDGGQGFSIAGPRVMMNYQDMDDTGVVQPGSRIFYRWLLSGEEPALEQLVDNITPVLGDHYRIRTLQDSQRSISSALDRGKSFLMLSGMIGVLLAGVAIAIAAQQFAERNVDAVALFKSLGASAVKVRRLYFSQLVALGLLSSFAGLVTGEILHRFIASSLATLFNVVLIGASWQAYGLGIFTGLVSLLCFALPPLWPLPKISPVRVLRREINIEQLSVWTRGLIGLAAVVLLIGLYSRDLQLTLTVVVGLIGILAIAVSLSLALLNSSRQLGSKAGSTWRLAMSNLRRNRGHSSTQIVVFSCALMLLMVLFTVRTSLIDEWRLQLPENAPNHFVLNINASERDPITEEFEARNFEFNPLYPMVLGRLVGKNEYRYQEDDRYTSDSLQRELNLSWADELAPDNEIVDGQWWDQWQPNDAEYGVSIEYQTAQELGAKVGDELHFSLGGLELKATIASIRTVDWDALTPNFYFLFSPGALEGYSPTYLTSVYVPNQDKRFINEFLRKYPTLVILEVDRIIDRIKAIVDQVSRGIELVLWVVLLGGVLVLIAAVSASMARRMQEASILRALGSGGKLIVGSLWIEFSVLGFFSGLMAAAGAELILYFLQSEIFGQTAYFHGLMWLIGPVAGSIFIGALGAFACRRTVTVAPALVLRELQS